MDKSFSDRVFSAFEGGTVLVGFSGGADSTAALLLAKDYCDSCGKRLIAVHFNHHLRGGESDNEAVEAETFAENLGVEFRKIDLYLSADGGSLENRAREARLEHWQILNETYPGCAVVTGHHADDKVENLFLRLGRGSNVSGLTGLRADSVVCGVRFLRPLLEWNRQNIETYLRQQGITRWAQDSSNKEDFAKRNILRNNLIPQMNEIFPGGVKALMRTLEMLEQDAVVLENLAGDIAGKRDLTAAASYVDLPGAIGCRLLRKLTERFFPGSLPLSHGAVRRFLAAAAAGNDCLVPLGAKRILQLQNGIFSKYQGGRKSFSQPVVWDWRDKRTLKFGQWLLQWQEVPEIPADIGVESAVFDAGKLPDELTVSTACPGMTMVPFGRTKSVKLKKLRVDRKIAPEAQNPVLLTPQGVVLWYAGVRHSAVFPAPAKGGGICFKIEKLDEKVENSL